MDYGKTYKAIVLSDSDSTIQQQQWRGLVDSFNLCMELEGSGIPMSAEVQRLYAASEALTTHINEQWAQHNVIRDYLKSWGYK